MGDSIHTRIQKIFAENPTHYEDTENLLSEIRKRICTEEHLRKAKALKQDGSNYDAIDGDLVRFRCILPQPALTEKYSPRFIGALDNGMNAELTTAFFNQLSFGIFAQINYPPCVTQSREVYKVCEIPGECLWAALPQDNASIDAIGKPKMEQEYVKLYIYDTPDENSMPEANLIIELYGIFYAKRAISNVPVGVNGMIKSDFFSYYHLRYPTIHVIQHKIIELKDIVPRPNTLFANTYEMLLAFARMLTESDIGARYLVAALASKTYSWVKKQTFQLCNLSFAFMNIANSKPMVDCLKLLCPAVLHIKITKELLENEPLYPVLDATFGEIKGNHLLHAMGTVIVCDFTKYEGDADTNQTANYAKANMYILRHLIEKQGIAVHSKIAYYTRTDAIVIVLMPPGRKKMPSPLFTPFIPFPTNFTDESDLANQLTRQHPRILSNFRWFLIQTREKLKDIQSPHKVLKAIAWKFADIRLKLGLVAHARSQLDHFLTLARIQTALEGGQSIKEELFDRIVEWEGVRLNLCKDWLATL